MSKQDKVDIFDILDMFNKEVGYKGLDNRGKKTDERDDVITRQTFSNWLKEYNATHSRKISSKKINQYKNEWFKDDIEKLIKNEKVQKKLNRAYSRNTVPLFEILDSIAFFSSQRISRKYEKVQKELREHCYIKGLDESMEITMNQLIDEVIENHFTVFFKNNQMDGKKYINKSKIVEDFIDEKKIEEEAFKLIDNYYGVPEYDDKGDIIAVHHSQKRPSTEYYLKF